ncbi:hypothetical protein [Amnibacterium endophyticum]|uniref:Uncharacterized protein n=1 Tax=Amnibacterium endophyticum TaxID=2109337 RepID=A0ABW4LGG5_9MICO
MRIRPVHLAVAALVAIGADASAGTAQAASTSTAQKPVGRYVAYQACQAAMWKWTAQNAEAGTSVASFRHRYRKSDVWRERHGWHVQVGGARGEKAGTSGGSVYCVVTGTDAQPKLLDYSFPR